MNEERNTDIQDRAELTDKHNAKEKRKTIDIRRNFPNKKKKKNDG